MRRSRLSQYKQNKLIELFVAGVTARTVAQLVGVNKNTAAYYFHRLRLLIFHSSPHLEMFDGEVEADESYFGGHRKGKRGRGAAGKGRRIRAFKAQRQGLYHCRTQYANGHLTVENNRVVYTTGWEK